jgi:hypothetical protein
MQQSIQENTAKLNLFDGYKKFVAHILIAHQKRQTRKQLAKSKICHQTFKIKGLTPFPF